MKRNKKLAVLVVLLVFISLAAFGVNKYEEQKEIIKNSDEIILEIAGDKVKTLSWECDTGSFGFYRDGEGKWLYDEDEAFPVDEERIMELLDLFEEFGVSFIIEEVEDFGQYGLDTPVCTIRMETGEGNYEIQLGNFSAMDSERYVSIGDGKVYLVKKDPLEQFNIEISNLIKHDEIPVSESVTEIRFSGGEPGRIVYEENSANTYLEEDVYFMEQGETVLPLDTFRVKAYLDTVRNLDLKDYVNYNASENDISSYGLDTPELALVIEYIVDEEESGTETTKSFVLNISRDPEERKKEENNREEADEDAEEKEVTAYARVGESQIIYQLSTEEYESLMDMTYDSLRHQEVFWADFKDVYQLDILLEEKTYTITSDGKDGERNYYYLEEELDIAEIKSGIRGLTAEAFTEEVPDGKEEISLTIYLEKENFQKVIIQLYRYDGEKCIAVVDGKPVAFVARSSVVDLMEVVNGVVLK